MELYRPLKNGNLFNPLFPKSDCKKTMVGNGGTDFSVTKIQEAIYQYKHQVTEVAKILKKNTLDKTVQAVHDFLYNHFQYMADNADQMLRSPACSWSSRHNGIDCKSYSILASAILLEMGYNNILRIVSYAPEPNSYSHIYVVVPIDQNNNNLEQGYYIIDGTLKNNKELPITDKKDFNMKHYTLNKPDYYQNNQSLNGFGDVSSAVKNLWQNGKKDIAAGDISNLIKNGQAVQTAVKSLIPGMGVIDTVANFIPNPAIKEVAQTLLSFDFGKIANMFKHLDCIGGSAYDEGNVNESLQQYFSHVNDYIHNMNEAVVNNDLKKLSNTTYKLHLFLLIAWLAEARTHGGWNSCSKANIEKFVQVSLKTAHFLFNATELYLRTYYEIIRVENGYDHLVNDETNSRGVFFITPADYYNYKVAPQKIFILANKPNIKIPAFEFTQESQKAIVDGQTLNIEAAVKSFNKFIGAVVIPDNKTANPTNNTGGGIDDTVVITPKPTTQTMGGGLIGGLIVAGLAIAFLKSNNTQKRARI